ncbi:MAG: hypothetical protein JW959_13010, partial [Pirellulales bacterium]|nr:hypothetical protein [Pirellulales bacterium]
MSRKISEQRRAAYYIGMAITIIGVIVFASVFVSGISHFGDFSNFEGRAKSEMFRALVGIGLFVLGNFIRMIGARGLAGSGVVLDPEKARDEMEPYSRMAGGMVKDALDEADVHIGSRPEKVVMIKCQKVTVHGPGTGSFFRPFKGEKCACPLHRRG